MIHTNIATLLVAFSMVAPQLQGAEPKPVDRIPKLLVEAPQGVRELSLENGGNDKTLLLEAGETPHVLRLPFHKMDTKKVEPKTLLWRPEDGQGYLYTHDPSTPQAGGPWLGVHVTEVSGLVASQLGLTPGMGLAIEHIVPGSPAAQAGLKQHDILTKLDDQNLINPKQLVVLVRSKKAGEKVIVEYLRKGEIHYTKAEIVDRGGKNEVHYEYHYEIDDEDLVIDLGSDPVVIDRKVAEKMNPVEKGALATAMAKGKATDLKQGMHTSLFFVENSNLVLSDDSGTYNLRKIDGKKRLVVLNPEGDIIYKGDLEDAESIEELPEGIREKVKEMTGQNKTEHLMRYIKKTKNKHHDETAPGEQHSEKKIIIKKNTTQEE